MIEKERLLRILRAAVRAPSGDNSQPWSFRVRGDEIDIIAHPERDHPILNVDARGTYLSLGALIENLVTAAAHEGFSADVSLPFETHATARVRFSQANSARHPLAESIHARHTNRGSYRTFFPEEALTMLRSIAIDGVQIRILTDRASIRKIADAASVMEETALRTKELHELFFSNILWDASKNIAGEPGLYIKTTELPVPVQILFRIIRSWPILRGLNSLGFAKGAAKSNASIYAASGAMIAVIIQGTQPRDYVQAGRAFERIWLEISHRSLAAQPLAGLLYLAEYVSRKPTIEIEPDLQKRVIEAQKTIYDAFDCRTATIAMLMRVGEPLRKASARSERRAPVVEII